MDDEKDTTITSRSQVVEPTEEKKKRLHGFKLTWGRCFDLFIVAINILVFIFSFIAFLCIAIYLINAAARVPDFGGASDQTCVLFAGQNADGQTLDFSSSSICYFILISPVIIWGFLLFFILFLSIKVCRAWKIGLFEIIICVLCIVCLIYNIIVSIVLSLGYTLTCSRLAELEDPDDSTVKQSCANGGVKRLNTDGTATINIEFVSAIATAQVTLWISALILAALSFIHLARIFIFSRRRVRKEEMRTRLKSEKKDKDESGDN